MFLNYKTISFQQTALAQMLKKATPKATHTKMKLALPSFTTPPLVSTDTEVVAEDDVVEEADDDRFEVEDVVALFEVEVPTLELVL